MEFGFEPSNETLQLSVLLIRHGERSPMTFHPDDPNKHHWPRGPSNLTPFGKQQAYQLGQQLRERYDGFLNSVYLDDEVYARSTDTDRCLLTAQACMAGLFPPKSKVAIWDAQNPWVPAAVHTIPEAIDPCSFQYKDFVRPLFVTTPECQQHFERHQKLYEDITISSGGEDLTNHMGVMDSICAESKIGLPTPHDCGKSPQELRQVAEELYSLFASIYPLSYFPTGHTMAACNKVISEKVSGNKPHLKMYLFFTHDLVLNILLEKLCDVSGRPAMAATVFFEVHKHPNNGQFYIKIIFQNGLDSEPRNVKMRGCGNLCPQQHFQKVVTNFTRFYAPTTAHT